MTEISPSGIYTEFPWTMVLIIGAPGFAAFAVWLLDRWISGGKEYGGHF